MQYEKKKIIMIGDIRKSGRKDTVEEIWLLGIDDSYANDDTKKNKVLRKGILYANTFRREKFLFLKCIMRITRIVITKSARMMLSKIVPFSKRWSHVKFGYMKLRVFVSRSWTMRVNTKTKNNNNNDDLSDIFMFLDIGSMFEEELLT